MEPDEIKILIGKYWEGITSLEEEMILKDYFNSGSIADDLIDEAQWFQYLKNASAINLKNELDYSRIEKGNGKSWKFESIGDYLKIAAAIAVVALTILLVNKEIEDNPAADTMMSDTFEDPQKAFEETKKALLLLSKNLGKGHKEVKKVSLFNEAKKTIESDKTN